MTWQPTKMKVISVKRTVQLLWKNQTDLKAWSINLCVAICQEAWLFTKIWADMESLFKYLKKHYVSSLMSDFHLFRSNEPLEDLHIYFLNWSVFSLYNPRTPRGRNSSNFVTGSPVEENFPPKCLLFIEREEKEDSWLHF